MGTAQLYIATIMSASHVSYQLNILSNCSLLFMIHHLVCSGSMHNITDRESASARMDDIQRSIENWEEKDINKQCYDFVKGTSFHTFRRPLMNVVIAFGSCHLVSFHALLMSLNVVIVFASSHFVSMYSLLRPLIMFIACGTCESVMRYWDAITTWIIWYSEGDLIIQEKGKDRERHAFLFDNMLILCKSTGRGRTVSSSPQDYRFKEKLLIKHLDVVDMEDTEGECISSAS